MPQLDYVMTANVTKYGTFGYLKIHYHTFTYIGLSRKKVRVVYGYMLSCLVS